MKTVLIATALIAVVTPIGAAAQPQPRTVSLQHGDLDLRDPRDAVEMLRRIRAAALRVCAPHENTHPGILEAQACHREAVARGVARLNAPAVTAAFEATDARRALASAR